MNFPNPLNAMQILWINIIMDGPPAQRYRGIMGVFVTSPQRKNFFRFRFCHLANVKKNKKNVSFEEVEGCK